VIWSWVGVLAAFGVAMVALWRLASEVLGSKTTALLALLLLSTNYTVSCYATGGLETMAQAALLTIGLLMACREIGAPAGTRSAALLSLTLAGAVLLRPDSALPAAILLGFALAASSRRMHRWRAWAGLLVPMALILGIWLTWKLTYYGRLLPNSFNAKVGVTAEALDNGRLYVWRFFESYALWPFFLLGILALGFSKRWRDPRLVPVLCVVIAWLCYVAVVGGDFMEFRFLVPVAPGLALLLAHLLVGPIGRGWIRQPLLTAALGLGVLVSASAIHAKTFHGDTKDRKLDSIRELGTFYGLYPDRDWGRIGRLLKSRLGPANPVLALDAVGAIPYFSGFDTVDMLGLNDRFVAEHGNLTPPGYFRPGHLRHASLSYLRERGVNFIIGHPTPAPLGLLTAANAAKLIRPWVSMAVPFSTEPIPEFTVVLMPLDQGTGLVLWYLTPKPVIDSLVVADGWPRRTFSGNE
jgi:arabinofuranosyltransferase